MSSTSLNIPPKATLQSLRNNLNGNLIRGVGGFFAKYFEANSGSAAVQKKMQGTGSAEIVNKLSADILCLTHFGALEEWLATFHSLVCAGDQPGFRSQSISKPGCSFEATMYLETSGPQAVSGSTRVFGEYRHNDAPVMADDDTDFLRFCERARQVFETQSARKFLHAFLICGTTLELWVFDRSGAYSSDKLDLVQKPYLLIQTLAGYTSMNDEEVGINTFVKRIKRGSDRYVIFDQHDQLHLRPGIIAAKDYIVGLGTTCYAASESTAGEPNFVVKFSWREDEAPAELRVLKRVNERNVWGIIRLLGHQDLGSIADLRHGLQFPQPFVNRTFSCVATTPLGRPIQKFASIHELLEVLCDLVKALRSLYLDGRTIHRDIAIKNVVIASRHSVDSPKGLLIDFDQALDLDNVHAVEPMVGSDGFMAIDILFGKPHTYRHDLESLFYVFLWLAIGNDPDHDDALEILEGLPKTSRLWRWCSMDFRSVGRAKAADMSPEGFSGLLREFSAEFAPLRCLARELHALIFPLRDGKIFTGTETEQLAVERLYSSMEDAFYQHALILQR